MKYHRHIGIVKDGCELEWFDIDPSEIVGMNDEAAIEVITDLLEELREMGDKYYKCRKQFLELQSGIRELLRMQPLVGGKTRDEAAEDIMA